MASHVGDSNLEAYQLMAEILITMRKVVHRGLEKAVGRPGGKTDAHRIYSSAW